MNNRKIVLGLILIHLSLFSTSQAASQVHYNAVLHMSVRCGHRAGIFHMSFINRHLVTHLSIKNTIYSRKQKIEK